MKTFTAYCAGKVIDQIEAVSSHEAGVKLAQRYLYPESIILVNKMSSQKLHDEGKERSELIAETAKGLALVEA